MCKSKYLVQNFSSITYHPLLGQIAPRFTFVVTTFHFFPNYNLLLRIIFYNLLPQHVPVASFLL